MSELRCYQHGEKKLQWIFSRNLSNNNNFNLHSSTETQPSSMNRYQKVSLYVSVVSVSDSVYVSLSLQTVKLSDKKVALIHKISPRYKESNLFQG